MGTIFLDAATVEDAYQTQQHCSSTHPHLHSQDPFDVHTCVCSTDEREHGRQ